MRHFKRVLVLILALSLLTVGGCAKMQEMFGTVLPSMTPTTTPAPSVSVSPSVSPSPSLLPSPSVEPSSSPSVSPSPTVAPPTMPVPTNLPEPSVEPSPSLMPKPEISEERAYLNELLDFGDVACLDLFSLGTNAWSSRYSTTFNDNWVLMDDYKAWDGKAVEIYISASPLYLVEIDLSSAGLKLGDIGEIYVDFMMMDGDQLNNWWPRITLNDNVSGVENANTVGTWRADGMSAYSTARGDTNYSCITYSELQACLDVEGKDLSADDDLSKIGFQFYTRDSAQHATFRIDKIEIYTVDEVLYKDGKLS